MAVLQEEERYLEYRLDNGTISNMTPRDPISWYSHLYRPCQLCPDWSMWLRIASLRPPVLFHYSHINHIKALLKPDVYGVFPHHAILSDTSWGFYNVTQFKHHLPGDGISSHRLRAHSHRTAPHHFRSWSQIQVVICASKWLAIKISSHDSLFRFNSLVRVTHRTQESSFLTVCQFITEGYGKETSRWKRDVGQEATLPVPPCIHQSGSFPNPILLGFLWKLYHIGMIDHFPLLSPLWRMGAWPENSQLLIMGWSF